MMNLKFDFATVAKTAAMRKESSTGSAVLNTAQESVKARGEQRIRISKQGNLNSFQGS